MAELFRRSAEHILLAKHLQNIPVGGGVTYEELDRVVGSDVRKNGLLSTVRNAIVPERFFFVVDVRGESIKRVDDASWSTAVGPAARRRIKNLAIRGKRKLAAIEANELSSDDRLSWVVHMTVLSLHEYSGTGRVEKEISRMAETNGPPMLREVLARLKDL